MTRFDVNAKCGDAYEGVAQVSMCKEPGEPQLDFGMARLVFQVTDLAGPLHTKARQFFRDVWGYDHYYFDDHLWIYPSDQQEWDEHTAMHWRFFELLSGILTWNG